MTVPFSSLEKSVWKVSSILFPWDINSFLPGGLPSGEPSCPQNLPRVFLSAEIWWKKDSGVGRQLLRGHVPRGGSVKVILLLSCLLAGRPPAALCLLRSGCCKLPQVPFLCPLHLHPLTLHVILSRKHRPSPFMTPSMFQTFLHTHLLLCPPPDWNPGGLYLASIIPSSLEPGWSASPSALSFHLALVKPLTSSHAS